MTKIEAYIRTQKLEEVQTALEELDVSGMTVIEVKGIGRSKGVTYNYRGSQYTLALTARLKLEIVIDDSQKDAVVAAIQSAANTGEVGDGKIVVTKVEEVVRIRTGEKGATAL